MQSITNFSFMNTSVRALIMATLQNAQEPMSVNDMYATWLQAFAKSSFAESIIPDQKHIRTDVSVHMRQYLGLEHESAPRNEDRNFYFLNEAGQKFAPYAVQALIWANRNTKDLGSILGDNFTHENGTYRRVELLLHLNTANSTLARLSQFGTPSSIRTNHLEPLQQQGILTFETFGGNQSAQCQTQYTALRLPEEIEPFYREKTLTQQIGTILERKKPVTVRDVAEELERICNNRPDDSRIRRVLNAFASKGYALKEEIAPSNSGSTVAITDLGKSFVYECLVPLLNRKPVSAQLDDNMIRKTLIDYAKTTSETHTV